MLALLTLSLASAEPNEDTTAARSALLETATTCCIVQSLAPTDTAVPMNPQRSWLRMSRGHTQRGGTDYLGGAALSEQLIAVDGVPMMIDGLQAPVYQRTGVVVPPRNLRPVPRPSPAHPW